MLILLRPPIQSTNFAVANEQGGKIWLLATTKKNAKTAQGLNANLANCICP